MKRPVMRRCIQYSVLPHSVSFSNNIMLPTLRKNLEFSIALARIGE